ncbi:glycosyltransferase family 2 protein [Microvirga mediterraneensis]|uniref:Glycosyltransferase n=1 Tax=Microvirga mediterraneensis TaxID=2754695 RepID=A0A838BRY5_9HYPH|nr:glycosyltransferase family A protein [Microvirga mediterraneensis]MBA1158171.1 glycosyltransferase [Microvirga mediterraneensis]
MRPSLLRRGYQRFKFFAQAFSDQMGRGRMHLTSTPDGTQSPELSGRPRVHVIVPTYNRPNELRRLLSQIDRESPGFEVSVHVYDDGSSEPAYVEWSSYPNIASLSVSRSANHGKKRYWELVHRILSTVRSTNGDYFYYLADDVQLVPKFFERSIALWDGIRDSQKVSLHLLLDQREGQPCWTNYQPHVVDTPQGKVYKSQWVDMLMMFNRRFLEELEYRIDAVDPGRWNKDPNLSSGVGMQISRRLHQRRASMYLVTDSLLIHEDEPSVMNPEERRRSPIVSRFKEAGRPLSGSATD